MNRVESHDSGVHGTIGRRLNTISRAAALVLVALLLAGPARAQMIIHVDTDAVGANDGTSWEDAFVFLQDALAVAHAGDEVWVAEGVYRPDQGAGITLGDREASFDIPSGIFLYGGFNGTETSYSERDPERLITRLSGDLLANDDLGNGWGSLSRSDNSYHVVMVRTTGHGSRVRLDGLLISDGQADGTVEHRKGAGILLVGHGALLVVGSILEYNFAALCGGGLYARGTAELRSSIIRFNHADSGCDLAGGGGGAHIDMAGDGTLRDPRSRIVDTVFEHNSATEWAGGLATEGRAVTVLNSLFLENQAGVRGGAAYHAYAPDTSVYINTRFLGNKVLGTYGYLSGGAMYIVAAPFLIANGLFAANIVYEGANQRANDGGAVSVNDRGSLIVINSTFGRNAATEGGAISAESKSGLEIYNSIIWANYGGSGQALYKPADVNNEWLDAVIGSSISQDGIPDHFIQVGEVLTEDPQFANPDGQDALSGTLDDDYHLLATSPAIDRGDNDLLPPDSLDVDGDGDLAEPLALDLDGNPRLCGATSSFAITDLGAYELPDLAQTLPGSRYVIKALTLHGPYPNPVRAHATLEVRSAIIGTIHIEIFDILGRSTGALVKGVVASPNTTYTFELNTSALPSGVYFLSVSVNQHRVWRPFLK